ncbi:potassium channel family protein [Yinghuangia soli]|uniref:Potassium channel family protein n=1 Tax=Yinghuangia soli TaxID=2908204 RepID=A0AA41Q4E9_9ACTN|nr:potassium channel family protein [Yinghuangia soli]MCF2530244.1 potassium channel family protein [Yinghuangia soli]
MPPPSLPPVKPTHRSAAYDRWERVTTPWLTLLAVVSLTTFVVGEALRATSQPVLWIEYGVWAVFLTDYLVRLKLSRDRWRFVRTHPLDLAAVALPAMRLLRLIAVIGRIGMIAHRGRSERLLVSTVALVLTILVSGAAAVLAPERGAENANITDYPDALWWAISTVTTVGYGDLHPVTPEGRLVGVVLMVVGIGMMGVVTATIASRVILPEQQAEDRAETARLEERLASLEEQLARALALLENESRHREGPGPASSGPVGALVPAPGNAPDPGSADRTAATAAGTGAGTSS